MERFAYDFCRLTGNDRLFQNASNLTELWWDEDKQNLLNLVGMTTGEQIERFSDYEKFRALCRLMPMLDGHPIKHRCKDFLTRYFACDLPMDEANCDEIWQMTAQELLLHPRCVADLVDSPVGLLWEVDARPKNLPKSIRPILCAERLMSLSAPDWRTWIDFANDELDAFATCGCDRVYIRFCDDFRFETPNLYRVEQTLKALDKKGKICDLLLCQVVRFLCEACAARGWSLQIEVEDCADEVLLLLNYAEQAVGLPRIVWSTANAKTRDGMLAFAFRAHKNSVLPILNGADHPSDGELSDAMQAWAARYPAGMLSYSCGGSLIDVVSDRRRFEMLEKWRREI